MSLLFADENGEPLPPAPTCCAYHRSGGHSFVSCGVDEYDPTWEDDVPEDEDQWGSFRDGMRRYWRSRTNG